MSEDCREARFLAAQQARLLHNKQSKQRRHYDEIPPLIQNEQDENNPSRETPCDQSLRRQFWSLFKEECGHIRSALHLFLNPLDQCSNHDDKNSFSFMVENNQDMYKNQSSSDLVWEYSEAHIQTLLSTLYVTANQRNQAVSKLRDIKSRIRIIQQCTQDSSSVLVDHKHVANDNPNGMTALDKISPSLYSFIHKHDMVALVSADVRLMEMELQSLKDLADKIEGLIQPREKFSFRRYRAYCLEKLTLAFVDKNMESRGSLLDTDKGNKETTVIPSSTTITVESTLVDHLELSERKNLRITVDENGDVKEDIFLHQITSSVSHQDDTLASSYIIRRIVNCHAYL